VENRGEFVREARAVPSSAHRYVQTVGKLVTIRIGRIATVADVASVQTDIVRAIHRAVGPSCVICSDCRAAAPFPPDVVDAWSRSMRENNHRFERAAMLVDANSAMFSLQAARAVRCAGKSERHIFTDPDAVLGFLDAALTDIERFELRRFLAPVTV
jgi:hypothetical protein